MKRMFDVCAALAGLVVLIVPMTGIWLAVRLTSPGPGIHWSRRVGRGGLLFAMPKFRTMRTDAPQLATHLLHDADVWLTPAGRLMRRYSIDELPQLWSVLVGDMSLVGPRPALFNQDDLIELRARAGVDGLRPGVTGWAQINGRDEISLEKKVALDAEYLARRSLLFDLKILLATALPVMRAENFSK